MELWDCHFIQCHATGHDFSRLQRFEPVGSVVLFNSSSPVNWICISSDNTRRQYITWINTDWSSIGALGINSSEVLIKVQKLSFT